ITDEEKDKLLELSGGKNLKQLTKELIIAFDPDEIETRARIDIDKIPVQDRTPALLEDATKQAQELLMIEATTTFNATLTEYVENVRKQHEQSIDSVNIDTVTKSEWDTTSVDKATQIIKDFTAYLEANKDEIKALSIFYNQPYNRRDITFKMIKEVMEKIQLEKPLLAPDYVWEAYAQLENVKSKQPKDELTALISLIRRVCGIDSELKAYDKTIEIGRAS